jgi:hypothetical protein
LAFVCLVLFYTASCGTLARVYAPDATGLESANRERGDAPSKCVQEVGDMIYVPALWGHATLNERQSFGVAYELFL